jgi:hypothetical protein
MDVGGGGIHNVVGVGWVLCVFQVEPTFILPLFFFLCQFPSSWQLGSTGWWREGNTCGLHLLFSWAFRFYSLSAFEQHSTALQRCVWCLIIFSLSILWPFEEGRGHSDQNDRFPSYEVVSSSLAGAAKCSSVSNAKEYTYKVENAGLWVSVCCLLNFWRSPWFFFIHDRHFPSQFSVCIQGVGSPHLFLIIHYLQFHPLFISDSTSLWWNPAKLLYQKNTHSPKLFSIVDFVDPCLFSCFH